MVRRNTVEYLRFQRCQFCCSTDGLILGDQRCGRFTERTAMTNTTWVASLAYKAAMLRLLLPEANFVSERLRLPPPHPITMADLQNSYVPSPKIASLSGGTLETTNFFFSFKDYGLYLVSSKVKNIESFDLYPEWHKTPSLIDTNGAHQLSMQWLASIDVDTALLARKYPYHVEQAFYWYPPGTTNKAMLPVFRVLWDQGSDYPAHVRILGTTKEVMSLGVGDPSLSRRPRLVITNAMDLNNTDPPDVRRLEHVHSDSPRK
jgi:hypothetical protein